MPVYSYKCEKCEKVYDIHRSIEKRNQGPVCCGQDTKKIISNYYVPKTDYDYVDPNLGDHPVRVTSKKHRYKLMKAAGVIEKFGKGWV